MFDCVAISDETPDLHDMHPARAEEHGPVAGFAPTATPVVPARPELFVVNRDEALVVAAHWIEFLQGMNLFWQCYRQYSRSDEADKDFARWRLDLLRDRLGMDVLRQIQEQSDERLRKRIGQERWRICTAGTEAERLQFAQDNENQTDEFMGKFYDDGRADRAFARLNGDPTRTYTDEDGDVWFFGARWRRRRARRWAPGPRRCRGRPVRHTRHD